jgi:cell division protein FtsQ
VYGAILLGALYAAYHGSSLVAHAKALQIDRIVVHGNERLSHGEVLELLDGLRGENLVRTDLGRWRNRLLASPWVRDAELRRSLPSTLDITLWERRPAMIGRLNGEMYLVDEAGAIIDQYGPQYADLDLPIVDGLAPTQPREGSILDEARAGLAARVIGAIKGRPDIAKRVSQIDVSDLHNASVILSGDSAMLQLGEDEFLPRLQSYVDVASVVRERVPNLDSVDLRFDDRIYVRTVGQRASGRKVAKEFGSEAIEKHDVKHKRQRRPKP